MAFNEQLADRVKEILSEKKVKLSEKRMFGGLCFMVDDKMCCGTHIDKESGEDFLLCRIGEAAQKHALQREHVIPMEFTGRAMKGYVFVKEKGFDKTKDLAYWLDLCLEFNPQATSSKKKKK